MIIEKGKVKIESMPININDGMIIEVNGEIAVSIVYNEESDLVYCNIFDKYHDEPITSIFLEVNK